MAQSRARSLVLLSSALAFLGACASNPDAAPDATSLYALVTQADGVFLYPPLAPEPSPAGAFDPTVLGHLSIVLEAEDPTGAISMVATFDQASSPALALLATRELYWANVPAATYVTDPSLTYRFRVVLDGEEIASSELSAHVFEVLAWYPTLPIGVKVRVEGGPRYPGEPSGPSCPPPASKVLRHVKGACDDFDGQAACEGYCGVCQATAINDCTDSGTEHTHTLTCTCGQQVTCPDGSAAPTAAECPVQCADGSFAPSLSDCPCDASLTPSFALLSDGHIDPAVQSTLQVLAQDYCGALAFVLVNVGPGEDPRDWHWGAPYNLDLDATEVTSGLFDVTTPIDDSTVRADTPWLCAVQRHDWGHDWVSTHWTAEDASTFEPNVEGDVLWCAPLVYPHLELQRPPFVIDVAPSVVFGPVNKVAIATLVGEHFTPDTVVNVDGADVTTIFYDATTLGFVVPDVGGLAPDACTYANVYAYNEIGGSGGIGLCYKAFDFEVTGDIIDPPYDYAAMPAYPWGSSNAWAAWDTQWTRTPSAYFQGATDTINRSNRFGLVSNADLAEVRVSVEGETLAPTMDALTRSIIEDGFHSAVWIEADHPDVRHRLPNYYGEDRWGVALLPPPQGFIAAPDLGTVGAHVFEAEHAFSGAVATRSIYYHDMTITGLTGGDIAVEMPDPDPNVVIHGTGFTPTTMITFATLTPVARCLLVGLDDHDIPGVGPSTPLDMFGGYCGYLARKDAPNRAITYPYTAGSYYDDAGTELVGNGLMTVRYVGASDGITITPTAITVPKALIRRMQRAAGGVGTYVPVAFDPVTQARAFDPSVRLLVRELLQNMFATIDRPSAVGAGSYATQIPSTLSPFRTDAYSSPYFPASPTPATNALAYCGDGYRWACNYDVATTPPDRYTWATTTIRNGTSLKTITIRHNQLSDYGRWYTVHRTDGRWARSYPPLATASDFDLNHLAVALDADLAEGLRVSDDPGGWHFALNGGQILTEGSYDVSDPAPDGRRFKVFLFTGTALGVADASDLLRLSHPALGEVGVVLIAVPPVEPPAVRLEFTMTAMDRCDTDPGAPSCVAKYYEAADTRNVCDFMATTTSQAYRVRYQSTGGALDKVLHNMISLPSDRDRAALVDGTTASLARDINNFLQALLRVPPPPGSQTLRELCQAYPVSRDLQCRPATLSMPLDGVPHEQRTQTILLGAANTPLIRCWHTAHHDTPAYPVVKSMFGWVSGVGSLAPEDNMDMAWHIQVPTPNVVGASDKLGIYFEGAGLLNAETIRDPAYMSGAAMSNTGAPQLLYVIEKLASDERGMPTTTDYVVRMHTGIAARATRAARVRAARPVVFIEGNAYALVADVDSAAQDPAADPNNPRHFVSFRGYNDVANGSGFTVTRDFQNDASAGDFTDFAHVRKYFSSASAWPTWQSMVHP